MAGTLSFFKERIRLISQDRRPKATAVAAAEAEAEAEAAGEEARRLSAHVPLCPYDLRGRCNDRQCLYQHSHARSSNHSMGQVRFLVVMHCIPASLASLLASLLGQKLFNSVHWI